MADKERGGLSRPEHTSYTEAAPSKGTEPQAEYTSVSGPHRYWQDRALAAERERDLAIANGEASLNKLNGVGEKLAEQVRALTAERDHLRVCADGWANTCGVVEDERDAAQAKVKALETKLQRVRDWLKFAANSEGGIVAEIDAALASGQDTAYDPAFGDDKLCACGHRYYRHFDTYEGMAPVGCKYCPCRKWQDTEGE